MSGEGDVKPVVQKYCKNPDCLTGLSENAQSCFRCGTPGFEVHDATLGEEIILTQDLCTENPRFAIGT